MSLEEWEQKAKELNLDPVAINFLKGDPTYQYWSPLGKIWIPVSSAVFFGGSSVLNNLLNKYPLTARLPVTFGLAAIGLGIGLYGNTIKKEWSAEKDALYFHYMTLHPEEFQAKERVMFRDYLSRWLPIR